MSLEASSGLLDATSGLVALGEVNERSGFLCKIGGFCLLGELTGECTVRSAGAEEEAAFIEVDLSGVMVVQVK